MTCRRSCRYELISRAVTSCFIGGLAFSSSGGNLRSKAFALILSCVDITTEKELAFYIDEYLLFLMYSYGFPYF